MCAHKKPSQPTQRSTVTFSPSMTTSLEVLKVAWRKSSLLILRGWWSNKQLSSWEAGCWGLRHDLVILSVCFESLQISTLIYAVQTKIACHRWKIPNLAFREQMRYPDMWLCFGLGKEHQILCLVQFIPKTHYNLHFNSPSCYKTICGHYQNCVMPYVSELHFFCPCSTANTF